MDKSDRIILCVSVRTEKCKTCLTWYISAIAYMISPIKLRSLQYTYKLTIEYILYMLLYCVYIYIYIYIVY